MFAFTRALGRRELSTLQPFDLILLMVIGDLIQSGVTQTTCRDRRVMVVCTIGILQVLTSIPGFPRSAGRRPAGRADRAGRERQTHRP